MFTMWRCVNDAALSGVWLTLQFLGEVLPLLRCRPHGRAGSASSCPECGAETRAGARFCVSCGASLERARRLWVPPGSEPVRGQGAASQPDAPLTPVGTRSRSSADIAPPGLKRVRGRWLTSILLGGGVAAAIAVAAGIALALLLLVGGDEGGDGVGGELDIVLQIMPKAVLLGQDQTSETLTLQAFHHIRSWNLTGMTSITAGGSHG